MSFQVGDLITYLPYPGTKPEYVGKIVEVKRVESKTAERIDLTVEMTDYGDTSEFGRSRTLHMPGATYKDYDTMPPQRFSKVTIGPLQPPASVAEAEAVLERILATLGPRNHA